MVDDLELAEAELQRRVDRVTPEMYDDPTPCADWSVRDLLDHVIGGAARYAVLITGAPTSEVEALRGRDYVRDDPAASLRELAAALAPLMAEPGAMERTVHHRVGDLTGAALRWLRVLECTVHGWDLARATAGDESIDPRLAEVILTVDGPLGELRAAGFFLLPEGEVPSDPGAQVLHLVGRTHT